MSIEEEFTEYHKDSFVRAKAGDQAKKPVAPAKPAAPAAKDPKADDYVPEQVGKVVDNVFGKLDNLVNDAADYLFGSKKKGGGLIDQDLVAPPRTSSGVPPLAPKAPVPNIVAPVAPIQAPVAKQATPAKAPAKPQKPKIEKPKVTTLSTLQSASRAVDMIQPVMPEAKPKYDGPVVNRTTSISELELPLEILDDPDLLRYFDQMKLYEHQVISGGLCNLPLYEAVMQLKKGHWQHRFRIRFEELKRVDPGIYPMEMARSRFAGMKPVYKAMAWQYSGEDTLRRAIEDDINAYLQGKQGQHFHRFVYQVVSTRY
ncbi:hypothetical protein COW36_20440 [bacterium (Candidatus Blackallbacteria) CG17_big_fil_post_rev_8_21_14_2_50_48_46]|uniref:Uncharacterized protein n=1 Tax=bacterium (Candidatus Blackallbacteria) CG17_big_fil_post_rev_8_21_14_2_50_48_46 TaxID=2014261 RepID=A0A2M7FZF3_9BACT|nr:MAG: hypothetical protein COW64_22765 [bacterium (Candidatus Blackallbacteria) CG18_big_fil_WC_8_21_14_2_50_49_26]PIW14774.1 MAG: hypothetical protein COW36_20440 [bacterium (Candidatus Blackallbacteria) CG17_big_fil_post_rev_8_21_14_2_50_48_46]PIW50876.1 MAG: hypothetical protein COW20_01255 [bacterium (Candidatus Blackallbacteria) CG13_big_fil_rev_8_21_14_2_50_49_14]